MFLIIVLVLGYISSIEWIWKGSPWYIFCKSLCRNCVTSLNLWWNSALKPSGPGYVFSFLSFHFLFFSESSSFNLSINFILPYGINFWLFNNIFLCYIIAFSSLFMLKKYKVLSQFFLFLINILKIPYMWGRYPAM